MERDLFLARGAKVLLTKNLHQEVGLVNGIRGEVKELVYAENKPAPHPPLYVVVKFDGYSGGSDWSEQERYSGCVLIAPVDSSWADGGNQTRTQLPLKLCWAIAMHKSQGQTLQMAVIDLGVKEACTGLTFVCLSRAKNIRDLVVEPMAFDRLSRLGESPTLKARLNEEVRLRQLSVDTIRRYTNVFTGVGV